MKIRKFAFGDEPSLYEVFYSSVHENAKNFYSEIQLNAWAPKTIDKDIWKQRIRKIKPFILEDNGIIVGYADLQDNGYIDHFFIRGNKNRHGFGQRLMNQILEEAKALNINELFSDVSLSAEMFFQKNGFEIVMRKKVTIRGSELENSLMQRHVTRSHLKTS